MVYCHGELVFVSFQKRKTLRASLMAQRRLKANGVNEASVISVNVESGGEEAGTGTGVVSGSHSATGIREGDGSGVAGVGVGAEAVMVSCSGSVSAAPSVSKLPTAMDLPIDFPPPPSARNAPPSPTGLPDVPPAPAPPAPRWGNDIRQRHIAAAHDEGLQGLPPPPPPPAGVDTMRLQASFKTLFGPDPPDLVA